MSSKIKPKTGGLAAILRLEKERRAQEEQEQNSPLVSETAPTIITPGVQTAPPANSAAAVKTPAAAQFAPPSESTAPAKRTGQPLQNAPAGESAAPAESKGASLLSTDAPHLRTPHEITDKILPTLKPGCQVVLMRLYRLSAGFGSDICHVSIPKLASACNISETQIRIFLRDLEQRKLIKRLSVDLANKIQSERGITFQVLLPRLAATKSAAGAKNTGGVNIVGGAVSEPNKVNTQKENTQTQDVGVRVGSRFTIEECRRYAEHLKSTGQGITNPGGYATTIHRTGEADELIERFLNPLTSIQVDASQCPDCKGSGFYYPSGQTGGVAKCKHEKLQDISKPDSVAQP
ncbi:MAG TPA: hypothetical protein VGC66_14420 [Pyrinomonadaceae bacterium]|jgi:hypothetical protein